MNFQNTDQLSDDEKFDIEEYGGGFSMNSIVEKEDDDVSEQDLKNTEDEKKKKDLSQDLGSNKKKLETIISKSDLMFARRLIRSIKESNEKLTQLFSDLSEKMVDSSDMSSLSFNEKNNLKKYGQEFMTQEIGIDQNGGVVEGVFDGSGMMGPDGRQYSIPFNYSSKSKLVEGDVLKLTITPRGSFVYKQINPIERIRVMAKLDQDIDGNFNAISGNKKWKLLLASVTYFKGEPGDEVVILIPKKKESKWAAIENIIKK